MAETVHVLLACDRLGYETGGLHGGGRSMVEWTRGLLARGVRVTPVILRASERLQAITRAEGLSFVFLNRASFDLRTASDLVRLIRERGVQVVHLQGHGSSMFGRLAARRAGVPAIVHVHADYRYAPKGYPWYARLADRVLAPGTARVFAVSEPVRDYAVSAQGFRPDQVQVLHNPVDRDRFRAPAAGERERVRDELGLGPEDRVLLSVGRLDRLKGLDLLLAGWPAVLAAHPGARLLLAGDGPERAALEASAAAEPWAGTVRFLGRRADVERLLWAADLSVMASRMEGLPLAALESMSAGVPVVAPAVGGIPEIVRDGENGLLVEPERPEALARAIVTLLGDAGLRDRLSRGATAAMEAYGLARFAERLEGFYREVVGRG